MNDTFSVATLRADFDGIFAEPRVAHHEAHRVLLTIRVGADRFAIPIEELGGLKPRALVVSLPSRNPHLLGLAGLEGNIVPVFRLPALLGYSVADDRLRWLAVCGRQAPVALAVESVDGTARVKPGDLCKPDGPQAAQACISSVVRIHDHPHSVLDVTQLMAHIEQHAHG